MSLGAVVAQIRPVDRRVLEAAQARQGELTKPPGALGRLEEVGNRLAAIAGCVPPPVPERALVTVFAADHGIQAHGVSPWPQEVTTQMVATMLAGGAGVSVLSRANGADLQLVDVGMVTPVEGALDRRIAAGTADFSVGPAMTRAQALAAVEVGIDIAQAAVADGYQILIAGECGIGNTTAAAALVSVFTGRSAVEVTGGGAGSVGSTLRRKQELIAAAVEGRGITADDPIAALAEVGGFEHAAMVGFYLAAAAARVPVILDGVIACSAALVAARLAPDVLDYCIAGHLGVEPGIAAALDVLQLEPLVDLGLRLGEATGALTALPMVRAAARILGEMATFDSASVSRSATAAPPESDRTGVGAGRETVPDGVGRVGGPRRPSPVLVSAAGHGRVAR